MLEASTRAASKVSCRICIPAAGAASFGTIRLPMPASLLRPLLKPGVTDLVLTSEGRLSLKTYGRWSSATNAEFRELFPAALAEVEPRALERLRGGEKRIVRLTALEGAGRVRAVILETTGHAGNVVLEISLRICPQVVSLHQLSPRLAEPFSTLSRGLVIIVGGSGMGKTTVQSALVQAYLQQAPVRAVVLDEYPEFRFSGDAPVTYVQAAPSVSEIEAALLLGPRILVTSLPSDAAARNRLALAATTQLVVTTLTAADAATALQAWTTHEGGEALLSHALAGVVTVNLDGDGQQFSLGYQGFFLSDHQGQSDAALRLAIRERNWAAVANRLQAQTRGPGRKVA